jgi:hypothetical protein
MPEVRRRRPGTTSKPVTRRRDLHPVEETEEEEEENGHSANSQRRVSRAEGTRARRPAPRPAPRRDIEDEEDEDEEEESRPAKRPASRPVAKKASAKRPAPPAGIGVGMAGAEEVIRSGLTSNAFTIDNKVKLFKVLPNPSSETLECEPFVTVRVHWVPSGKGPDTPHNCIGRTNCPLCAVGSQPSTAVWFNVLWFQENVDPELKIMRLGVKAYNSLRDLARDRRNEDVYHFGDNFFSVQKSGKNQQSQTTFRSVKQRDLEDDWPEIVESFDMDTLDEYIADLENSLHDYTIVKMPKRSELDKVARYLTEDDEEEED